MKKTSLSLLFVFAFLAIQGQMILNSYVNTSTPTVQASVVAFPFVENNALGIRATRGNGSYILIVAKSGGAVDSNPVDGTTYTANAAFGSGTQIGSGNYVVYKGSTTLTTALDYFAVITALSDQTTYHFRVYEFNGSGGYEKYLTTSATGSQATKLTVSNTALSHWDFDFDNGWNSVPNLSLYDISPSSITYGTGKVGRAAVFNGTTGYLELADNSAFSFGNGSVDSPFSFACWINPTNLSATRYIFNKRGTTTQMEYQLIVAATTGNLGAICYSGGGNTVYVGASSTTGLTAGAWNHVAWTYDPSLSGSARHKIYINGTLTTMTNNSAGSYVAMSNGTSTVRVGQSGASGNFIVGSMDQVSVSSSVLSQTQVTYLYNSSSGQTFFYNFDALTNYEHRLFILATRDRWMFATDNSRLYWSNDHGLNWTGYTWGTQYAAGVPVYNLWPSFAYIFDDGTVLFATAKTLYRSVDGLANISTVTPKGKGYLWTGNDNDDFLFHTPVDPTRPGNYFMTGSSAQNGFAYVDGVEVLAWTTYANVGQLNGAAPTIMWYSADKGATVRAFYMFGQNLNQRDDGTDDGGTTGTILGNATNALLVRHGHLIVPDPLTGYLYSCTGDYDTQVQWQRHEYNTETDIMTTVDLITGEGPNSEYMGVGFQFNGATLYYVSDAQLAADNSKKGVFSIVTDDIPDKGAVRVLDLGDCTLWNMQLNNATGKMLIAGENGTANIFDTSYAVAENFGAGAVSYISVTGANAASNLIIHRFFPPTGHGYVKMNVGGFRSQPGVTALYKLGTP